MTAGYKAVLHIHSIVEECEIIELISQMDPKTKKPMKKHIRFVKNGAVVVCKIQVCIIIVSIICLIEGCVLLNILNLHFTGHNFFVK